MAEAVKVAVRCRPFNQREKDRNAKCIINMNGQNTTIANPDTPKEEPKTFAFDYSYWSHDGFTEDSEGVLNPIPGSKYASQQIVFDNLGKGVLNNAFEGYNCSLFAYGQTGSGKSYSMVGYGKNRGIVPIICDDLFKTMNQNNAANMRYEVTFSMLEIYNEQVRDLLQKENPKGGLQVRQNPKLGLFYVQSLKYVPVGSYAEIEKRIEQGTANRTVASTNMNATSSRAHTVVTIIFDQISKDDSGSETKKSSVMNLVDLAGSERADSTGATGDRLKEGANINKSLSALGNVISALADQSMGKKKVLVPYRDSVLTKLLQNALGGNSKTIMIAALSPADINYDETLSTLRYADRAKKIKNNAVVNENPIDKLIRELKEENERLKKSMSGGGVMPGSTGMSAEDIEKMKKDMEEEIRAQLEANMAVIGSNSATWEERLKQAQNEDTGVDQYADRKTKDPHFVNLNEDPMLSNVIFHYINPGVSTVGRQDRDGKSKPDICLSGLSILSEHATLTCSGVTVELKPAEQGAKIKINGQPVTGTQTLVNKDRVMFGSNHLYVFINPKNDDSADDLPKNITYEFAQKEIAQAKGFATGSTAGLTKEQQIVQEQVLEILPMVSEVNAISEELNKYRSFEVVLLSAAARGAANSGSRGDDNTRVMVKMKNLLNSNTWLWERGKFMNRRYIMQEMYQSWLDGEDMSKTKENDDPFWEPTEDVLIGTTNMYLRFLCFPMDFDYPAPVKDYKGQDEGVIDLYITPCTANGKNIQDLDLIASEAVEPEEAAEELRGKPFNFKIDVISARVDKARFSKGLKVKYKMLKDKEDTETKMVKGTVNPEFKHSKVVKIPTVTQEWIDFFLTGHVTFELYGLQQESANDVKLAKMSTKELRQLEQLQKTSQITRRDTSFSLNTAGNDSDSRLKSEFVLLERKYERLLQKEKRLQQLCEEWNSKSGIEKQFKPFHTAVNNLVSAGATSNNTASLSRRTSVVLTQILAGQKALKEQRQNSDGTEVLQANKQIQNPTIEDKQGNETQSKACTLM
ncbi:kinesin-like protein KIF28 [Watersipora subatra]|uniref:kinesin-like protein KIF28 n=1 Tax=Watersipora subatra TaxID=2589382 RepID=UPI00355B4182